MQALLQQLAEGISVGAIYALLGLAISLIHRATNIANFAQGELAMFATQFAWQMLAWGCPMWLALMATILLAFTCGALLERVVIRPVEGASLLTIVIVTFGLYLIVNNLAGYFWGYLSKSFTAPFSDRILALGQVRLSYEALGCVGVLVAEMAVLHLFLRHTRLGLAIRAVSSNPASSVLVGIDVGHITMISWGAAAAVGAMSGVLIAPRLFLDPSMMGGVLVYSFAGLALGGIDSPVGAVLGCLLVGVIEALASTYIDFIGSDLRIVVPLGVIVATLMLRPGGLFARRSAVRV